MYNNEQYNPYNTYNPYNGYAPYTPYTPYTPTYSYASYNNGYGSYMPMEAPAGSVTPDPFERRNIKSHLSATFSYGIIHILGVEIIGLLIAAAIKAAGYEFVINDEGKTMVDWVMSLAGTLPSIILCFILFAVDKHSSHNKMSDYLNTSKIKAGPMTASLMVMMFFYAVGILMELLILNGLSAVDISPIKGLDDLESDLSPMYLAAEFLSGVLLAPVAEELLFRGVIMRRAANVSQRFAIVFSAMCFGLMHGNLPQSTMTFTVGLLFAYVDIKTGSLIPSILMHMLLNLTATSSEFVEYFFNEDAGNIFYASVLLLFGFVGLIILLIMIFGGKAKLPEYTERHKKRSWAISITCVSFWIMMILYVAGIVTSFGKIEA